jgi:hypothetical protein
MKDSNWYVAHDCLGIGCWLSKAEFKQTRKPEELGEYEHPANIYELVIDTTKDFEDAKTFSELEARLIVKHLERQLLERVMREHGGNLDYLSNYGLWECFTPTQSPTDVTE